MTIYEYTLLALVCILGIARVYASVESYRQSKSLGDAWYQNQDDTEKNTGYDQ